MSLFTALWETFKSWFDRDRVHLTEHWFVDPASVDPPCAATQAVANTHYFRLKLVEMFLGKQVAWFQNLYPAVHSMASCTFGGQTVEIPNVADLTRLGIPVSGGQGDIVARNFVLVPTLPFNGGSVAVTAGLVALTGENYLARFLKSLSGFAGLLAAPQLSAALTVAQPLAEGMQDLFGAGNGRMHLGYLNTLDGGSLKAGYFAVIRAADDHLNPTTLRVSQERLCRKAAGGKPQRLVGYDYLLFKLEVFTDRDDWRSLTAIDGPFRESIKLLIAKKSDEAQQQLTAAVLAAYTARELTEAHRVTVIAGMKKEYEDYEERLKKKKGLAASTARPSLESVMMAAPNPEKSDRRPITLVEALTGILPRK